MEKFPFIFSDEKRYRLRRHLVFWVTWWIFQGFLYSFISIWNADLYRQRLASSMLESLVYLAPHMFLSYSIIYYVIPKYLLKQKYWVTASRVVLLFLLTGLFSSILSLTIIDYIRTTIIPDVYYGPSKQITITTICLSLMAGLRGGITIAGIASAIKLMKYWYIKEQRNLQLQKENIASQLQLLKAQIHPHFLFNTLNNIYAYTQKVSPVGSSLVMGLSDLLRYILHEGNQQRVALSRELKMINDYMLLEQIRYGNRLEIYKEMPADTRNLVIAPLLLLPFIENCFKHGTSQMLEQAWIRLSIQLNNNIMKLTLINARVPDQEAGPDTAGGIGIGNVRKRLDLLYPGKYELTITAEEDAFIVNLHVELEPGATLLPKKQPDQEMIHV